MTCAPTLETPWHYFRHDLTPNEAFYVRWHLEAIPTHVELQSWRLRVGGHVERPLELSMEDLRRIEPVSLVAVNQCSGNSRSLFAPQVPGGQWQNGAMGNARWTGVRLGDLLRRAGLKAGAVQVCIDGLDEGPLPSVPDFVKALDVDHACEPEVLVAYEMNGAPLPMLNGFPARLVVPGWYATYWVKALSTITVVEKPYTGFWMATAYKIPTTAGANELPQALAAQTVPINRMNVRSFFVRPDPGARRKRNRPGHSKASPSTAGTAFARSNSRPTAGSRGRPPAWAKTWDVTRSAAGTPSGHPLRRAITAFRSGP